MVRASAEGGRPLRNTLLAAPELAQRLGPAGIDRALDPRRYLGSATALIGRALAAHR